MKKAISMLVMFVMLLSVMPFFGAGAAAEANLIFEMDLSTYGVDGKIGNAVEGHNSEVSITSSTQSPILNATDSGTKYITFRKTDVNTNSTAVKVADDDIAAAKELTIETWVRLDGGRGTNDRGRLFGLGNASAHHADFYLVSDKNVYFDVAKQSGTDTSTRWARTINTADNYDDKWTHFVVTRKLIAGVTNADTDTCEVTVYINGIAQGSASTINVDMTTCDSADKFLVIGAHKGGTGTLWGDMGSFKIYNSILTSAEAAANYETSKADFYPEPTGEKLIFDMDLSEYTNENMVVKNSAKYVDSTIEVSGAPVLGTTGTQKYLTFMTAAKVDDTTADASQIKVTDSYLINQTEQTFETWIRGTALAGSSESYGDSRLFSITNGTRAADLYILGGTGVFRWRPNGGTSDAMTSTMKSYDDKWTHVVYTRKWTMNETDATKGTWASEMYINGKQVSIGSVADVTKTAETNAYLTIGNSGTTQAFFGDIATFKVYNTVLTEASIAAKYEESAELFVEEDKITFARASGEKVDYLDDLETLNVAYSAVSSPATLYVASYGSDRTLLAVTEQAVTEAGDIDIDVVYGTDHVKVFLWEQDTLRPLTEAAAIGYSEGYRAHVFAQAGAFYNVAGEPISSLAGQSSVTAKASCTSLEPAGAVYASLVLQRGDAVVKSAEVPVNFKNGVAEASVSLTDIEAESGDIATFKIYDSTKEYFTKKIGYEDLSRIVDILLVAGQSNALGQGGNAAESIKTEPGTVYYQTMNDGTTLATTGNQGWASSLGKTWHDETGHTVLIVKATWGGTGFPSLVAGETLNSDTYGYWNPGNSGSATGVLPRDCYTIAQNYYTAAVNSINTEQYTIGNRVYFWNQGENENKQYTAEQYETAFLALHNKFLTEFGKDDNTRLQYGGIIPVRSSTSDGVPANLNLTGPRIAHYKMTQERDDLYLVSDLTEHWYSDSSIAAWFKASGAYPSANMPDSWSDIMNSDNLHYTQRAMNEMGREAAKNMLNYLSGGKAATGLDLITPTGIQQYKDGDSIYLTEDAVIPRLSSASGKKASFALSGTGAEITEEDGLLVAKPALLNDYTTLTVTVEGQADMTFNLYSPIADETVTVAAIKDNKSAIYTLTTDDGYKVTNQYLTAELKERGLVGTMGLVPAYIDEEETKLEANADAARKYLTWDEAEALVNDADSVWDVANHTQNHKQGTFLQLTEAQLEEEIDGGRNTLLTHFPNEKVLALFTPGGQSSDVVRQKAKENHLMLRIVASTVQSLPVTGERLFRMPGYLVQTSTTASNMDSWVNTAINQGGWLVELWHGAGDPASGTGYNLSVDAAEAHLDYVKTKKEDGSLWVTTLDEAAIYATQRLNSQIKMITNETGRMVFTLTDEKSTYTSELTVNVTLPESTTVTSVTCGGAPITHTATENGISFNILPNSGEIEIMYQS